MGIDGEGSGDVADALGGIEPAFAAALARVGLPEPRISERGYVTLLRAIVGQQVSIKAAAAIWARVEAATGGAADPAKMARDQRRGAARRRPVAPEDRLCEEPRRGGALRPARFRQPARRRRGGDRPPDARSRASAAGPPKSICCSRKGAPDIWPAGDLAVQIEIGSIMGLDGQADREGGPRARRGLAPPPRRRRGLRLAPSAAIGYFGEAIAERRRYAASASTPPAPIAARSSRPACGRREAAQHWRPEGKDVLGRRHGPCRTAPHGQRQRRASGMSATASSGPRTGLNAQLGPVIVGAGIAEGVDAPIHRSSATDALPEAGIASIIRVCERDPVPLPFSELRLELRGVAHRPDLRLERLDRVAPQRKEEGDRLSLLEPDPMVGPGEAPVHREAAKETSPSRPRRSAVRSHPWPR